MAIAAMTLGSFSAAAQTKKDDKKNTTCTEQQCPADKQCDRPSRPCPFEGMNLTDTQKQQLKQLQQDRPDKAARKQAKRESRQQERRAELAKIKAILTPEQYVTYLENLVVNGQKQQVNKGQRKPGNGKAMRPDHNKRMANRPEKGERTTPQDAVN